MNDIILVKGLTTLGVRPLGSVGHSVYTPRTLLSRDKILASPRIPDFPAAAVTVIQLARSRDPDLKTMVAIVKGDPDMCRRILRTINSSLFGLRKEVTSVDQAVILLGTSTIATLATGFSIMSGFMPRRKFATQYQDCLRYCLTQAACAEALAEGSGRVVSPAFFTAGLLQDVGMLALLKVAPDQYAPVLERFTREARSLVSIEREVLGLTHVEITEVLMHRWNIPEDIRMAAIAHHTPPNEWVHNIEPNLGNLQQALATATNITELIYRKEKGEAWISLVENADRYFDLKDQNLVNFLCKLERKIGESGDLFAIDMSHGRSMEKMIAVAKAQSETLKERAIPKIIEDVVPEPLVDPYAPTMPVKAPGPVPVPVPIAALPPKVQKPPAIKLPAVKDLHFREAESGAYTFEFFQEIANFEFKRSVRYRGNLGILMVEFTDKKTPLSAAFRKQITNEIQETLRATDVLAASGYRTFAILALSPLLTGLGIVAERIRRVIQKHKKDASIGAVIAWPSPQSDGFDGIWAMAEKALAEAKSFGPGQNVILTLTDD